MSSIGMTSDLISRFLPNFDKLLAFSIVRLTTVIFFTCSFANPAIIALEAPPAPSSKTFEFLIGISLFFIGSRKPSISVLYPLREPLSFTIVFAAPISLQFSSTLSNNFIISIL